MTSRLLIPKVIAHRGARAYAPENTLAAIHTAADLGIEWVELDVKLTADDIPVIFHDENLLRCTGNDIMMVDTTWQQLSEMDAGSWYGDSFIGEKVPTLEDALNVILDRGMGVNLEIKPCPGREVETAEAALDIATRIWPEDIPPPLVSSFSHVSLETARDMLPEWPRGFLMDEHQDNWKDIIEYLDAYTININGNTATREQVEEYIEAQKPILAYTINDPELARELLRWGIDGFFADNPDVIREAVEMMH
jgi:glycerophosphoryl diester phosphodiesterase